MKSVLKNKLFQGICYTVIICASVVVLTIQMFSYKPVDSFGGVTEYGVARITNVEKLSTDVDTRFTDLESVEYSITTEQVFGVSVGEQSTTNQFLTTQKGIDPYSNGNLVITSKLTRPDTTTSIAVIEQLRLPTLFILLSGFAVLIIAIGRWRGFGSLVGLFVSIVTLTTVVIPLINASGESLFTSILATVILLIPTIYLSHGWNNRTHIAMVSLAITTTVAIILSTISINILGLTGLNSEDTVYLQSLLSLNQSNVQLTGILLVSLVIGTLGILDDVTTTQVASIEEIKRANPRITFKELLSAAHSIGTEHVASLVNTLFLAYAAVSLPTFLILSIQQIRPMWVLLNNEFYSTEILRTLIGSSALILAVPITNAFASWLYASGKVKPGKDRANVCMHAPILSYQRNMTSFADEVEYS